MWRNDSLLPPCKICGAHVFLEMSWTIYIDGRKDVPLCSICYTWAERLLKRMGNYGKSV